MAIVSTGEELQQALLDGVPHIQIVQHLDLTISTNLLQQVRIDLNSLAPQPATVTAFQPQPQLSAAAAVRSIQVCTSMIVMLPAGCFCLCLVCLNLLQHT